MTGPEDIGLAYEDLTPADLAELRAQDQADDLYDSRDEDL